MMLLYFKYLNDHKTITSIPRYKEVSAAYSEMQSDMILLVYYILRFLRINLKKCVNNLNNGCAAF